MAIPATAKVKSFLIWYLRQPFVMIVWFMETFSRNRQIVKDFMATPKARQVLTWVLAATGAAWLAIALLADDRHGERLDCAMKKVVENDVQNIECRDPAG